PVLPAAPFAYAKAKEGSAVHSTVNALKSGLIVGTGASQEHQQCHGSSVRMIAGVDCPPPWCGHAPPHSIGAHLCGQLIALEETRTPHRRRHGRSDLRNSLSRLVLA